jgi:F-type H+-transporting ATPase subunit b
VRRLILLAAFGSAAVAPVAMAAEGGMPQFDFANPLTLSQVVWMGVIFVALYVLLGHWALPQVAEVLEARAAAIGRDLEAARVAKRESDAAVAALAQATQEARAAAQAEIARAHAAAKQQAVAEAAVLNARLDAELADAERQIEAARVAAMGALREVAADTAEVLVIRLIGRAPATDGLAHALDAALAARGGG